MNFYTEGWKKVMQNKKKCENYTKFHITLIINCFAYLLMVYFLSLQYYNTTNDFNTIINMAIDRVNYVHLANYNPHSKRYRFNYIIWDPWHLYILFVNIDRTVASWTPCWSISICLRWFTLTQTWKRIYCPSVKRI